jgi:hypothetical protein
MRRLFAAVGTAGFAASGLSAPNPGLPTPDGLVERLSADRFSDREAAGRALLKLGNNALAALDRAAGGADPEMRERAGRLADRIRRTHENDAILVAPPVSFDYAGVPLDVALADLKVKTHIPLLLAPGAVANPLRPVTAKAGPLPPWEAVAAFTSAVGLRETFTADAPAPAVNRRIDPVAVIGGMSSSNYLSEAVAPLPGMVPVRLADGKPEPLAAGRSAAVRVTALPPSFPGNRVVLGTGEVVLNLDVAPLPGLRWQETTAVRITRAEDQAGRPVERSFRPDEPPTPFGEVQFGNGLVGNIVIDDGFSGLRPAPRPNPRVVPIKLLTGGRALSHLRLLEGVVVGEVSQPDQTLVEVPDLARAHGLTFRGPHDARLTVVGYEMKEGGRELALRLRVDGPHPSALPQFGLRNRVAFANSYPVMPGSGVALAAGLGEARFYDAAGRLLRPPPGQWTTDSPDGIRQTQDVELSFPRSGGFPVRMTAVGNKSVAVEVPFRLSDVELP